MLENTTSLICVQSIRFSPPACSNRKVDANGLIGTNVSFQRIRRITGYLVGTLDKFNDAKRREEADRVRHVGISSGWIDRKKESESASAAPSGARSMDRDDAAL